MRKILTLILLAASLSGIAQKKQPAAVYAYMQPSHPGIVPANYPNATLADYRLFVAAPNLSLLRIRSVRIGGKSYAFTTEKVAVPLVQVYRDDPQNPKNVTLVPSAAGQALQVVLKKGPTRPGAGALQVSYSYRGKIYTRNLDWKELPPQMNE